MADTQSSGKSVIEFEIVPVEEEEKDLDTIAIISDVSSELVATFTKASSNIDLVKEVSGTRSGIIDSFQLIVQNVINEKDTLTKLLDMALGAITLLAKQKNTKKIEINFNGKTITIDGGKDEDIKSMLAMLDGLSKEQKAVKKFKVKAKVSKHGKSNRSE